MASSGGCPGLAADALEDNHVPRLESRQPSLVALELVAPNVLGQELCLFLQDGPGDGPHLLPRLGEPLYAWLERSAQRDQPFNVGKGGKTLYREA